MNPTSRPIEPLSGWRKAKDVFTNFTITAGGMGILLAILLIFFYLLYEIMPLFQSASLEQEHQYSLQASGENSQTLYLGMEEQAEVAVRLSQNGQLQFFRAQSGEALIATDLVDETAVTVTAFAINFEQDPLLALGNNLGQYKMAKPEYKVSYPNDQRLISPTIEYPYGEQWLPLADQPLQLLAIRDSESEFVVVGLTEAGLVGKRIVREEDFLTEEITLEEQSLRLPRLSFEPARLHIAYDQRHLFALSKRGDYAVVDLRNSEILDSGKAFSGANLADSRMLLGGISLMVADSNNRITQWFMVRADGQPPVLQKIRDFTVNAPVKQLLPEHRRKGIMALTESDDLEIFYTTSGRSLLNQKLDGAAVKAAAVSPRSKALLVENQDGVGFSYWKIDNEHPEVSWQVLWEKIWYESYPEPDYIWQSSASNNDFEPKFSFSPLAYGTLKAAFYAMLLATPLALCGAIYTAYFMSPVFRRKIKPLIELMEALPTVILGFLAGLWLAPFIERNLPGVFSLFLLMPVGVLLFGYLWSRMPDRVRLLVPDGWHPVLLAPVIIIICLLCIESSPLLERAFFEGDMRRWLTNDLGISFDQRNALVVGIAMGFAVIPTIFSIAEDAVFSVPKHLSYGSLALGATPWQTLVGVVLPTASPGIFSALMIGMGRAVGETMIVLMATGNTPIMDANIFEGMRTLAANIAVEIGETEVDSTHYRVLFLAAFVLFMFTFVVNTAAEIVRQRLRKKYGSL